MSRTADAMIDHLASPPSPQPRRWKPRTSYLCGLVTCLMWGRNTRSRGEVYLWGRRLAEVDRLFTFCGFGACRHYLCDHKGLIPDVSKTRLTQGWRVGFFRFYPAA